MAETPQWGDMLFHLIIRPPGGELVDLIADELELPQADQCRVGPHRGSC